MVHSQSSKSSFKSDNFLEQTVLGYLTKLKMGLGLAFGFATHFLHDFSVKMFLV